MENKDNDTPEIIKPAEFVPIEGEGRGRKPLLSPLKVLLASAVLILVLVLWFLFTARSVLFILDPPETELEIDGGLVFHIGANYLLRPGDYRLQATHEGYHSLEQDLEVTAAANQEHQIELNPLPGILDIDATPEEVTVMIDGKPRGTAPGKIPDIPRGNHRITFSAERYLPKEQDLFVEGLGKTQSLEVRLEPGWGFINLSTRPEGAEVFVGGQPRGVTPLQAEVLQAGEEVAIRLDGYRTWKNTLSVAAGSTVDYPEIELEEALGLVRLSSSPSGASVNLDGVYQGLTPLELQVEPRTGHQLKLLLEGYQSVTRELTLEPAESRDLALNLKPLTGVIRLEVEPADARVLVDGNPRGTGSQTLRLTARSHRLEVEKPGYVAVQQTITPRPGLDQSLKIRLLTHEEARWAKIPPRITAPTGIEMKLFRPNHTFTMGSPRREPGRRANEVEHRVKLSRPFYMATLETTNEQYRRFKPKHTSRQVAGITLDMNDQPVVYISWLEAAEFCNWLSEQEGLTKFYRIENNRLAGVNAGSTGYRLPTEAEWAWVARVTPEGALMRYPWGSNFPPENNYANYADSSAKRIVGNVITGYSDGHALSAPVGTFNANLKGILDLSGNVSEWVHDFYSVQFSSRDVEENPLGPESGEFHTLRGASWRKNSPSELRLSYRDFTGNGREDLGFRIARYAE